jgi:hypothetical protein
MPCGSNHPAAAWIVESFLGEGHLEEDPKADGCLMPRRSYPRCEA